jgi:hypothetical protein
MQDDNLIEAAQTTSSTAVMLFELIGFGLLFFFTFVLYLRVTHDIARQNQG